MNFWGRYAMLGSMLLLSACARVQKTSFISSPDSLQNGKHLERVAFSPGLNSLQKYTIEVKRPLTSGTGQHAFFPPSEVQDYLLTSLVDNLESGAQIQTILEDSTRTPEHKLILETAVTEIEPGSKFGRFMAGDIGVGHSHVQVEGRLIDPATDKILLQFVDRRAGSAMGGQDITGGDPRSLVEDDLEGIANALAKTLAGFK